MTKPLYQLLYLSSATADFTERNLLDLLAESQSRNEKRSITGLLLHSDGNIIQIIEGRKEDVETLFSKIEKDSRHTGIMVLSRRHVEERDFPKYNMGFRRTQITKLEENIPGFTDMVEQGNLSGNELEGLSNVVAVFLRTFARTTRMNID
jgi:hypothetical protein